MERLALCALLISNLKIWKYSSANTKLNINNLFSSWSCSNVWGEERIVERKNKKKEKCRRNKSPAFFNSTTTCNVVIYNLKHALCCFRTLSNSKLKDIHNHLTTNSKHYEAVLELYRIQNWRIYTTKRNYRRHDEKLF